MDIVKSVNDVPIRLTDERWIHIVENHDDLAGYYNDVLNTVESPDLVIKVYRDALIALKKFRRKYLQWYIKKHIVEMGLLSLLILRVS